VGSVQLNGSFKERIQVWFITHQLSMASFLFFISLQLLGQEEKKEAQTLFSQHISGEWITV
jgi:hypothetical protein